MLEDEDGMSERGLSSSRRRYEDEEDYHSIYIGVPVPRGYRRKRRRRRSPGSSRDRSESERHFERQDHSDTDDGGHGCYESGNDNASRTMSPAAERLRYILGEDDEPPNPTLFTEMDTLQHDGEEMEWKESARWIKFEEKVEEGGERWSKPHVSTLSLHSLFELRTCLQTGTVLLDLDGYSLPQIIDDVIEKQIEDGLLKPELREKISYVLLRKHRHQTKKPIHRSLADIGKSVSSNTGLLHPQGVMESFLGTAMAGSMFCLFAGQPLIILSSTGPILIFEKLLFDFSKGNGIDYMEFRLWIGLHSALQCLILVATDASFIIKYITRFTEEGFSTLISFIFIYDAIKKMIGAFKYYPINSDFKPDYVTMYKCECIAPDPANATLFDASAPVAPNTTNVSLSNAINLTALDWTQLSKKECLKYGGSLVGKSCKFVPDLALMSFILFFGTYSMTLTLKKFKFSRYFPTKVRAFIADFSNVFSILIFCGVDACFGLDTPKLHIPNIIKPTRLDRGWFVFPFGKNPWWVYLASALPALLVTILIFMDQQITAVIVNRKEHKLRKAAGYHLDLFWVGILMAVCSFMGLPWYVAATVISIAHIDSLKMETETSAPGEQPQFLGVREQRVTGIIVFVLTGISVFLAPILKYIPMPVLYGVFLYMGVASLNGIQFWDRCKLFLMPAKHQPDYVFLRHVPLRRIHLFTLVQIICLAVLWILKSTVAAIIFPVMILALILVRRLLDFVFSQHDLAWIDNIIPEKEKKKEDDKKKKKKGNKGDSSSDEEERGPPPGALRSDSSPNGSDMDRSITLHLKISCPSSPAFNYSRSPICAVPQVKIEMESDYEDTDTEKAPRDMGSETTL
ncbi:electrogenic sodium bicarbonate cotransporter 4 [Neopelma chrysocephalum]|uniref:electrogenic sodium bicarbonate cotransporter 4 n=1 Tax=Neopelma chrysocephalum TaxID=114329 RepID=UPI000FCD1C4D|nr:electrogenic sodium bicarbonate cotransporter 4 [Neopelma chrysocephalum]